MYTHDKEESENREFMGKIEEEEGFEPSSFTVLNSIEGLAILNKVEKFDSGSAFSSAIDKTIVQNARLI